MILRKLRHVWKLMANNKLFSAIYIFGTALALATVTVFAVVYYNSLAPVYPEYNRPKTAYISHIQCDEILNHGMSQSRLSYPFIRDYLSNFKNVDKMALCCDIWAMPYVQTENGVPDLKVKVTPVDTAFFEIFNFDFLAGAPFTPQEFLSGMKVAVVSEQTIRDAFGPISPSEALGKDISLDFQKYKITGVVKEASQMQNWSYANVYYPYTTLPDYKREGYRPGTGNFQVIYLTDKLGELKEEVAETIRRYNTGNDKFNITLWNQPQSHNELILTDNPMNTEPFSLWTYLAKGLGLLAILLLVPAMNLSGMISGQMESRISEMGIRKSFGATRSVLLGEVLWENFFLTLAGGLIGFVFAYLMFRMGIGSIFGKGDSELGPLYLSASQVFAPAIFGFVFVISLLLNILSAFVPAYRSLGKPIVESLKEK